LERGLLARPGPVCPGSPSERSLPSGRPLSSAAAAAAAAAAEEVLGLLMPLSFPASWHWPLSTDASSASAPRLADQKVKSFGVLQAEYRQNRRLKTVKIDRFVGNQWSLLEMLR